MTAPSTAARLARQSQRLESAMVAAVVQLTKVLPVLSEHDARLALHAAEPIPARILEELADYLPAHPDALASGGSLCPPVLLRLVHVLHDAGHAVVRPGCASCGKVKTVLARLRPEGRICGTCDGRTRLATCVRCGRDGVRIAARRPEGKICYACYHVDPESFKECGGCGQLDSPVVRLDDGGVLCKRCWKRPTHTCVSCGKVAAAALLDSAGALCHPCYNQHRRPRRPCGRCGQVRRIASNANGDQPDLCDSCYRGPEAVCSVCNRTRPCYRVNVGTPICQTCYCRQRPGDTCCRCQRVLPILARWPIGPVCNSCYTAILRSPAPCARCRTSQPLIALDDNGAGLCGPCAGVDVDYTCAACGRGGNPYGRGRCAHCVLEQRVADLLTGPDGTVSPQFQPLVEALAQADAPFKAIQWIRDSPNARLLAGLVAEGRPMSHELLDELPTSRNQHYIRQVLVQTGVLPERHEDLERLPSWLEDHLADKPRNHANLIRPFLHWFLLRRARSRATVRRYPASAGRDLRRRVMVALDLLAWLDEQKLRPGDQ